MLAQRAAVQGLPVLLPPAAQPVEDPCADADAARPAGNDRATCCGRRLTIADPARRDVPARKQRGLDRRVALAMG